MGRTGLATTGLTVKSGVSDKSESSDDSKDEDDEGMDDDEDRKDDDKDDIDEDELDPHTNISLVKNFVCNRPSANINPYLVN